MTIKVGDRLPDATLAESTKFDEFCPVAPESVSVAEATKGKRVVIFGLPGAFTPTCSAKHVPGYLSNHDAIKAKNVDEIWCLATTDGFAMAAQTTHFAVHRFHPHPVAIRDACGLCRFCVYKQVVMCMYLAQPGVLRIP